jgi:carboxymethylenebutenolidase
MRTGFKWFEAVLSAAIVWALLVQPALAGSKTIKTGANGKMRAVLMTPDGPGPYPAILVLHTSGGMQADDLDYAKRLVKEGFVVLVPYFLETYGIVAATKQDAFTTYADALYADFVASLDLLRQNEKVDGKKLGAVGFSNGGFFALWLAATGKVQAGVAYYGAVTGARTDMQLARFRGAFTASSSPVLILHGEADATVPIEKVRQLDQILTAAGSPHEFHEYPGAEHRFDRDGGKANKAAATAAWVRTIGFFDKTLKK